MAYIMRVTCARKTLLASMLASIILAPILFSTLQAAEQAETERLLRRIGPPPVATVKDKIYVDSFFESSDIMQGSRTGRWSEFTNLFGYSHKNIQSYVSISRLNRLDVMDYTVNAGSYITFKDSSVHFEGGAGWDVDYIYNLQTIFEYTHRLYKDLHWQVGYNYRDYHVGDNHLVYPGLIYYFGDHYMSADYGVGFVEGRDTAHFGTVKGNFAITDFINLWSGIAFGERLYDIYGMDARDEFGYILFTGLTFTIYKDVSFRFGGSYSTEKPKFIKRSLDFGLTLKF